MTSPTVKELTKSRALQTHRVTHDTFIDGADMGSMPDGVAVTTRDLVEASLQAVPIFPSGDERR